MCLVEESVFKIPSQYKCTNNYLPSGIESSFIDQRAGATNYNDNRYHYSQLDEDDIQIQIAIQQSIAMLNGAKTNEDNILNESSGPTQSLEEYHKRQNNRILNQNDEDLILQR